MARDRGSAFRPTTERKSRGTVALKGDPHASESYRFWVKDQVRFADLDLVGHVNNKSYTIYAESGRVAFLRETGFWTGGAEAPQNVIVRMEIDYLRELHYPADLRIGVRVVDIGRTSFKLGTGIFRDDVCVATATTVHVRVNPKTRKPTELTADDRRKLGAYHGRSGDAVKA